jgi:hypothetical protein
MNTSVHPIALGSARRLRLSVRSLCVAMLALCLTAVVPWLGLHVVSAVSARERVYALATLESHLARDPAAWLHRSLRVRALLGGQCTALAGPYTPACAAWRMALTDPNASGDSGLYGTVRPLPLVWGEAPPVLAFLRRLPMVGQMLPRPQIVHSSVPAVYQIQLRPTACVVSADPPCYEALLLDAIPPNNSSDWVQIGS